MMRTVAVVGGVLILAAVAHVTVLHTGGYLTPHSWLTIAVAAGVGVASICSGLAWGADRRSLALCLIGAIVAGELFAFVSTAERLIAAREALQAPLRGDVATFEKANKRVMDAMAALKMAPEMSERLNTALASKAAADHAAIAKASEKGCAANCRALLSEQVVTATKDVEEARTALAASRSKLEGELATARAALASQKAPVSASPLADRLGWPAWVLDLVTAALGSVAANGLAATLLIFASHGHKTEEGRATLTDVSEPERVAGLPPEPVAESFSSRVETHRVPQSRRSATRRATKPVRKPTRATARPEPTVSKEAGEFATACIKPGGEADSVSMRDLVTAYAGWRQGRHPKLAIGAMADELAALVLDCGLPVDDQGDEFVVRGVRFDVPSGLRLVASASA